MGPLHPILPLDMICHSTRWVNSPSMVPRSLFAGGSLAWVLVEFVYGSRSTAPERSAHAVRPDARRHAAPLTIGACLGGSRRLDPVTRLRAESAIAANVRAPHHRQTRPEERGMKKNAGRICGNFLF